MNRSGLTTAISTAAAANRHIKAPGSLEHRYYREDFGHCVLAFSEIARVAGVEVRVVGPNLKPMPFDLPGDIQSEDIEASLMPFVDRSRLKCHILVAPGHGIHPIPKAFGEAVRPEVSIASVFPRYAKGIRSTPDLKALGTKTIGSWNTQTSFE